MTKIALLTILLFSNFVFAKQSFQQAQDLLLAELSTTKEQLNKESLEWERKFYQSLIEDEDPNIKLLGYSKRISRFRGLDKNKSIIEVSSEINSMIFSDTLSHKSVATIVSMCSDQLLKPLCNHNAINERLNQTMSDNAFIYFNIFNLAYEDDNQEEINQALNDIAESTYIDVFMYSHEGYRLKLENYVKGHPFPKNKLAMEKLFISRNSHQSYDELEEISENMEDIMIFTMVIGKKMAEQIPNFRNLIDTCKSNLEHEKACLKIAKLFIYKSKTIISTQIGHAIKVEILKQHDKAKELKQAESDKLNHKEYYQCLSAITNYGSIYVSNKGVEFSRIADPIERAFGEIDFFETLAQLNYDYYSKAGDEKINNPKDCLN